MKMSTPKMLYFLVGILAGWLTVGVVAADAFTSSDVKLMIRLLERIEVNTRHK